MSLEKNIKKYAALQLKQLKFEMVEFFAKERADLIHAGFITTALVLLLLFGSLYASLLLNSILDSQHLGFGIIFIFWMILFGLLFIFKKSIKRALFEDYANQNIPS